MLMGDSAVGGLTAGGPRGPNLPGNSSLKGREGTATKLHHEAPRNLEIAAKTDVPTKSQGTPRGPAGS